MLIDLYIFLADEYHQGSTVKCQVVTRYFCSRNICIVWIYVYNKQAQQGLITGQKLIECLSWIVECLHSGSRIGCYDICHPSLYSLVNKVRVWCATWQLLQMCVFIAELKQTSKVSVEKSLYLDSDFIAQGHSAYSMSWQTNWTQTYEAKTLTEPLNCANSYIHKLAILSWKTKYLKFTSGAPDTNTHA